MTIARLRLAELDSMKHPIDKDLKSICDEIVGAGLSWEEWREQGGKAFYRGSCVCFFAPRYRNEGAFIFWLNGINTLTYDSEPMKLDGILRISEGQEKEIEIRPPAGIHPKDAGMRRVEVDPDVVFFAIVDGINAYLRNVLSPRGIIKQELFDNDRELDSIKHQVAKFWARSWAVSWRNEPVTWRPTE